LPRPDTIINSTDDSHIQLFALAKEELREVVTAYPWAELQREAVYTLVAGQESYALPADFLTIIPETGWNRSTSQRVLGPLTPNEWAARKSGLVNVTSRTEYRFKGINSKQLFLNPAPTAADAGQLIGWEYQSRMAVRPRDWKAGVSFNSGTFCWSNDNLYFTTTGGVTGNSPPIHSNGLVNDGGVFWGPNFDLYEPMADSDEMLLDPHLFYLGVKFRFLRDKGLDYEFAEVQYRRYLRSNASNLTGAQVLSFVPGVGDMLVDPQISEGSW